MENSELQAQENEQYQIFTTLMQKVGNSMKTSGLTGVLDEVEEQVVNARKKLAKISQHKKKLSQVVSATRGVIQATLWQSG